MRKTVLILTIAGGVLGVINSIVFYAAGFLTTFYVTHFFIPFIFLTSFGDELNKLIVINAFAATLLCITAAIAGIFYYYGDNTDGEKCISKYVATAVLVSVTAGLIVTLSAVSVILIGIASVLAVISVRKDHRNKLIPADRKLRTIITIIIVLSVIILLILGVFTAPLVTGDIAV